MAKIDTVIFDMDGVIVDSEPIHMQIILDMHADLGLSIPESQLLSYIGTSTIEMWSDILQTYKLDITAEELTKENHRRYANHIESMTKLPAVPGVNDVIAHLYRAGRPLALASSSSMDHINLVLRKLNLEKYFPVKVSGADLPKSKPDPMIFQKTAGLVHTPPEHCLVIEDSYNGVTAAKSAGMACIGYRNPNSGNQDLTKADFILDEFSQQNIEKIIEKITLTPTH